MCPDDMVRPWGRKAPWGGLNTLKQLHDEHSFVFRHRTVLFEKVGREYFHAITIQGQCALPLGSYGSQA